MGFSCSGPKPSVADTIRDKFARDGEVPLSFLKNLLPQEDEMVLMKLATDLNADNRGTVELNDQYAPLAKELRQKSPFLARFKRLAETATQWCLLSSCKEEKSTALAGLGKEEWNPGDDLSPSEAQEFVKWVTLFQNSPLSTHSLIPALRNAIESLPKEEQKEARQKLKDLCKPFLWHDDLNLQYNAQSAFHTTKEELVSIAENALRQDQQNIYALEFLNVLAKVEESPFQARAKQWLDRYGPLVRKNPENPFFNFAAYLVNMRRGKLEKAEGYLKKAIQLDPNNPHYLYYNLSLDPEKRLEAAKKLVSLAPSNVEYQRILGSALSDAGRNEEAVEAYKMAAKKKPEFYYHLGVLYLKLGKQDEAKEAFQKLLDSYPNKTWSLGNPAEVYKEHKNSNEAIGYYKRVLELDPMNKYFWTAFAGCYLALNNLNEAAKAYEMAERLEPEVALEKNLAEIYRKQENQEKLIATLVKITRQKEARPQDFENLAREYIEARKFKEAAEAYEGAVKAEPGNADYYSQLANNYFLAGEYDKEISTLQKAVSLFPAEPILQWSLGQVFVRNNRHEEGISHLNRAILGFGRLGMKDSAFLFEGLGDTYQALKKYFLAEQFYRKAIKLYTSQGNNLVLNTWKNLGQIYLTLNRFAEAVEAFTKAQGMTRPIDLLKALRGAGRLKEALQKAESFLQTDPTAEAILFQYALIQRDRGDLIAATTALEKIVNRINPNAEKEIFETLEKVYRTRGMNQEGDTIHQRWVNRLLQVQK